MTILRSVPQSKADLETLPATAWRPALILIGVAILIFAAGFHHEATGAVRVWVTSTAYNHCFLILPIICYLLWERRSIISVSSPCPVLWPLLLIAPLSIAWLIAAALDIQEGRQLVVVAMFEIVLLTALGPRVFGRLAAPLLFLFFLVPSGAFLTPTLQSVTAKIVVAGLSVFHVPVFSDGYLIDTPEGRFEVAEACAGLRFLVAAGVFSCLFAVVMYRSWWRRSLYIALSIVAAIVANGMRAFGIVYLAHLLGSAAAAETDHILYGWLFFSLVIVLLIVIGVILGEKDRPPNPLPVPPIAAPARERRILVVPLAAVLALTGPAYAAWCNSLVLNYSLVQAASPSVALPWRRDAGTVSEWRPLARDADREFLESFRAPGSAPVTRYIALYHLHATDNGLTSSQNRVADAHNWRVVQQGSTRFTLEGEIVTVMRSEIVSHLHRHVVWWFYVVNGRITGSLLEAKLLQLWAVLSERQRVGAFVAIAADMDDPDQQLAQFIAANQFLPGYVDSLRRQVEHH